MNKIKLFLISFCFLSIVLFKLPIVTAQSINIGTPLFDYYSPKDYNGSSQNWCITQDKRGVMYFGNLASGILTFNGSKWQNIPIPDNALVRAIACNNKGQIYASAKNNIGIIIANNQGKASFHSLMHLLPKNKRQIGRIHKIFFKSDTVIFIAEDNIIFYKPPSTMLIKKIKLVPIYAVKANDNIFVHKYKEGLFLLKDTSLIKLNGLEAKLNKSGIINIFPYKKNKILLISHHKGSYIYDLSKLKDTIGNLNIFHNNIDNIIKNSIPYNGIVFQDSLYAIGTLQAGVIIFNKQGNIIDVLNKKSGLIDQTIINLFEDKTGNLWLGLNKGIANFYYQNPIKHIGVKQNFEDIVLSVKKHNNFFYIGSINGLFYISSKNTSARPKSIKGLEKAAVWDFFVENKNLFAITDDGIFHIKDTTHNYIGRPIQLLSYCKTNKYPKHLLIGYMDGYYVIKKPEKRNNFKIEIIDSVFLKSEIRNIIYDTKTEGFWMTAKYNGIYYVKYKDSTFSEKKIVALDTTNGLPNTNNNYVYWIDNSLKICTTKGIFTLKNNPKNIDSTTQFILDSTFSNVFNDSLGAVQIQKLNNKYYINSDKYLGEATIKDNKTIWHTTPYKQIGNNFKFNIIDNNLYIYGTKGLYAIKTNNISKTQKLYHTVLSNIKINDSIIFFGNFVKNNDSSILFMINNKTKENIFSYENNNISFEFSALFFENINEIEYSYKLEGFNDEWSKFSSDNKAIYTNLYEGNYTFYVKAKNIYGQESTITSYHFKVLPPWQRSIWAYSFYTFALIVFIIIIVKLNGRRLRRINEKLEQTVLERTAEINQQKEEIKTQAETLASVNKELEKLSIVASETDNIVIIANKNGDIEWVNNAFKNTYEYSISEFKAIIGNNLFKTSNIENFDELVEKSIETKQPIEYINKIKTRTNKIKWLKTTISLILNSNNKLDKLIGIESDITKLKNAEVEIQQTAKELAIKNKKIIDSIEYAVRIQKAVLPPKEKLDAIFCDNYFVFYKPKDIVSGDFYWTKQTQNRTIVVAADCTGHGVPGAFMSLIGTNLLEQILFTNPNYNPAQILDELKRLIIEKLSHTEKLVDGMDISVVSINKTEETLDFAGAYNDLWLIRNNEMHEYKANKFPVGQYFKPIKKPFLNHTIPYLKNDIIYMFSDGYADQLGGPKSNEKYYANRLKNYLINISQLPMYEQQMKLEQNIESWKGNYPQLDDMLIFGIKL